jgi:protein arginine kinase activator
MLCGRCQKRPATIYLQQNINGQVSEVHLCAECAREFEKPVTFEQLFQGLINAFAQAPANVEPRNQKRRVCLECGLSFEDFKNSGKLGCAECYNTFRQELEGILKSIQGSNRHEGKLPQKTDAELLNRKRADTLKVLLAKAVENEEYEEAARLRDEIRSLEAIR